MTSTVSAFNGSHAARFDELTFCSFLQPSSRSVQMIVLGRLL
jgi:hypothetical protein